MDWQCSYDNNAAVCAKESEQAWRKQQFKNVRCKCEFGKYYESMGNDKPAATLPTMPTTAKTPPAEPPTETPNMTSSKNANGRRAIIELLCSVIMLNFSKLIN
ncbi:hypothetical protein niasHS_017307 [Heterodera schachtii]|uniref:Uncharacterized protein n=1 Tax=Heterodera schachtii TaxID=97005 RepID=A0ABD2HUJ3_HETSC